MPTEHEGLPVKGYQTQSQKNVDLVNEHKIMEEHLLRRIEDLLTRTRLQCALARTSPERISKPDLWR